MNKTNIKTKKSIFPRDSRLAADLIVGILMIALAILFIVMSQELPTKAKGIGPGVYPTFIASILLILGVVQTIKSIVVAKGIPIPEVKNKPDWSKVNWSKSNWKKIPSEIGEALPNSWVQLLRAFAMVIACYIFYKLIKPVGFLIMAPLFLYFSMLMFGYKKKVLGLIIAVVFTTIVYFLFRNVFQVMLPPGIFR